MKRKNKKINFYLLINFLKPFFFLVLLFVIVLFFLNLLFSNLEEKIFKKIWQDNKIVSPFYSQVKEVEDYLYNVFYATFSGFGWIDSKKTNLFHSYSMSAFVYPPKIFINKINDENLINFLSLKKEELKKTKESEKKNNKEEISFLPLELKNKNIVEKIVKKFNSHSIIVFKEFNNNLYYFWLGVSDGNSFKLIKDNYIFATKYDGVLSIEGDLNNFLVILSAYEGKGVQVKNLNLIKDISYLFEIRLMAGGGYKFNILKKDLENNSYWYLWFYNNNFLKFVKLFEDEKGWIVGGLELTNYLVDFFKKMPDDFEIFSNIAFQKEDKNKVKIYFNYDNDYYELIDAGFEKQNEMVISSLNINNYPFLVKKVKFSLLGNNFLNNDNFILEVSDNDFLWQKIELDKETKLDFSNSTFYWRLKLYPDKKNDLSSVFLRGFQIELFLDKK